MFHQVPSPTSLSYIFWVINCFILYYHSVSPCAYARILCNEIYCGFFFKPSVQLGGMSPRYPPFHSFYIISERDIQNKIVITTYNYLFHPFVGQWTRDLIHQQELRHWSELITPVFVHIIKITGCLNRTNVELSKLYLVILLIPLSKRMSRMNWKKRIRCNESILLSK
jgi:hypothetical protein